MRPNGLKRGIARSGHWRNLVQQQAVSGQPVRVFCCERGLTEQSFYYWRKRLSQQAPVSFALVRRAGSKPKTFCGSCWQPAADAAANRLPKNNWRCSRRN